MAFNGKFVMQSHENLEPFMKAFGIPDEMIKKYISDTTSYEIEQTGKSFKIKLTMGNTVVLNSFTLGEEAEFNALMGEKIKAIFHLEADNRLVVNLKGVKEVVEIHGDTLTATMTLGDITAKRIMKRV